MPRSISHHTKPGSRRQLLPEETALLYAMLSDHYPEPGLSTALEESEVEEMLDGGMGSIRFVGDQPHERHLGKVLREAKFLDADGTLVLISINLDQNGTLFEVDFWKVDFSPLCRYPSFVELTFEKS